MPAPDRSLAWIPIGGLIVNASWWGFAILDRSRSPDPYLARNGAELDWTYPIQSVAVALALLLLQLLLTIAVLRRAAQLAGTCAVLAIAYGFMFAGMLLFAMHAPTYFAVSVIVQAFAAGWLLVAAVVVAGVEKLRS